MRITIAYLQEKLKISEENKEHYYKKWLELKQKEDERKYELDIRDNEKVNALSQQNRQLMQIIRILAKDETLALEMQSKNERTFN